VPRLEAENLVLRHQVNILRKRAEPISTSTIEQEEANMAKSMRVVQVAEANGPLSLAERPIPDPRANEVRIRVQACGVCHSDAFAKTGTYPGLAYPIIPGHEVAGVIDAVGAGVSDWRVGQRVGVGWHGGHCNRCAACRRGSFIDCANHTGRSPASTWTAATLNT
jgi:D-arabinose 1-dehydrogenase-like Zn-dependent alcohol dehydrogenase